MPTWESHGSHRYYREPDLLFLEIHGTFTLADVQWMHGLGAAIEAQSGYILTVFDSRHASGITAEARRAVAARSRQHISPGATAVVGASLGLRAVVQLIRNALRLFGQAAEPVHFCGTAEEALEWLAGQRRLCANKPKQDGTAR